MQINAVPNRILLILLIEKNRSSHPKKLPQSRPSSSRFCIPSSRRRGFLAARFSDIAEKEGGGKKAPPRVCVRIRRTRGRHRCARGIARAPRDARGARKLSRVFILIFIRGGSWLSRSTRRFFSSTCYAARCLSIGLLLKIIFLPKRRVMSAM